MAGFQLSQQVQVGGLPSPRVSDLANDLNSLFGSVAKATDKYVQVGEQAAQLDFADRSRAISERLTELDRLGVENEGNPDFWKAYNQEVQTMTTDLVAQREAYRNSETAYNKYNELASNFAGAVSSKYLPRNDEYQLKAVNNQLLNSVDNEISQIGTDVTTDHFNVWDSTLQTVIKDPNKRKAYIDEKVFTSMFSGIDTKLQGIDPRIIQATITNEDGSFNQEGAVNLYNSMTALEVNGIILHSDGSVEVHNPSGNVKYAEETTKRLRQIMGFYKAPNKNDVPNFEYEALKTSLNTASPIYNKPTDEVIQSFDKSLSLIEAFKSSKGMAIMSKGDLESLFQKQNTLLADRAAYQTLTTYAKAGLVPTYENIKQLKFSYVDALGKKVDNVNIPDEMISGWKNQIESATNQVIFSSSDVDTATGALNYSISVTGKKPQALEALAVKNKFGSGVGTLSEALNRAKMIETMVNVGEYDQTYLSTSSRIYELNEKVVSGKMDEKTAVSLINSEFKTASQDRKAKDVGFSKVAIKALETRKDQLGFKLKSTGSTGTQIGRIILEAGDKWLSMSESEKTDYINARTYTTASGVASRTGWSNAYVVLKPKLASGAVIEEQVMRRGLTNWLSAYNSVKGTDYDMDDFEIGSKSNGALEIKFASTGTTVLPNMTAENLQQFYYNKGKPKTTPKGNIGNGRRR